MFDWVRREEQPSLAQGEEVHRVFLAEHCDRRGFESGEDIIAT